MDGKGRRRENPVIHGNGKDKEEKEVTVWHDRKEKGLQQSKEKKEGKLIEIRMMLMKKQDKQTEVGQINNRAD